MLIKTKQHFPLLYRKKLVYDFTEVSFCCFYSNSILIKAIPDNLS